MANLTLLQAVNDGLKTAMRDDPSVLVFGEDVGPKGGVFLATEGLTAEFGEGRCFDTPLSEDGIIGSAIGMAVNGMRPVCEIQFQDFIFPAFDQIVSEAAKLRYRSGGQYTAPMVIRTPYGGGIRGGLYHSQSGAAAQAAEGGIDVLVIDLRTLLPLDESAVLAAAKHTGRVVVVHEAPRFCGYGAEISALIAEQAIEYMEAPVKRVTGFDTPFPNTLEHHYMPDERRVLDAIEHVRNF